MGRISGPAECISHSEVGDAITRTKSAKAAGPSGLVAEMLRTSEDEDIQ